MKKNISINISGIIFHIEEDGYETLRKYLDSVNRYFASFEDSAEILADIEGRIAEIFLARLNEGKQVITAEDVTGLISTMGSVSDFKAAEEEETSAGEPARETRQPSSQTYSQARPADPRRLFRDKNRKILGGVCAGLGNYFNLDPVWPRVLFALLMLGTSGVFLLIYIVMWIVVPEAELEETSVKKMYRDPDRKVLGGVAAGIAAFFNGDLALIRFLFVIMAFLGFGIVLYIVLWIVLPEARTLTDKMKMQGEPVTLSNIESSVKKGMNERESAEESLLTRIILFPFRAIAAVFNLLGPVFRTIMEVLRVAIGIVITLVGFAFIVAILIGFGMLAGILAPPDWALFSDGYIVAPNIPLSAIRNSLPTWMVIAAFFTVVIPSLFAILLGSSIIARRVVFNATTGWSLFVLFFISVGVLSFNLPQFIYGFKEEGEFRAEQTFSLNKRIPLLKINETGMDDYNVTSIYLRGYEGTDIRVVKRFQAQGSSRKVAAENAQTVDYQVTQSDSVITFDSNLTFKPEAKFRAQRLDVDIYIPYDQVVEIEAGLWRIIDNQDRFFFRHDNETHRVKISREGYECVDCLSSNQGEPPMLLQDQFGLEGFTSVDIKGLVDARMEKGDDYAVEITGPEKERSRYDVYVSGETLVIDYDDDRKYFWKRDFLKDDRVKIRIIMPELKELDIRGAGQIVIKGFEEDDVDIALTGAVMATGDFSADRLHIELTGASFLDLDGKGRFMQADITGASGLRAYGYEVAHCIVEAHGACIARVNVSETLEIDKGVASSVSHRGDAEVIRR
ncbi:MAG: PspC domain-containing protein [Cyclobacteriaceae bacterium]|nr:PspC domain-containing protein [Cyclobacteriaceae bacterium]